MLGHVQWSYLSLILGMPHKIIAELEERETKKDLCLLLAKRSSLSTICLTIFLGIHEAKDKTKK
jgi:hypothetical protein